MPVKKQTAISSLTKLKVLLASDDSDNSDDEDDSASECDWLQERVGLDKMLETFVSQTPRSDPRVAVDEGLLNFWEGLLRNESSHDVVLETAQGSVGAHRLVLSGASSVLSAMLSSDMTEGREQRIQCTDATKESMLLLLDLMYTGSTTAEAIRLDGAVGAFELAHRWEIQHVLPMLERLLAGELSEGKFERIGELAVAKGSRAFEAAVAKWGKASARVKRALEAGSYSPALRKLLGKNDAAVAPSRKRKSF